ncbi:sialoadhesin-like [Poecilia formosa]|uniref:sialoadhesin-like n=1 Tax=Poecilia formosa TaxID=48698 RepID=UPI0007B97678|nr:PREDICTED: sialoadhesin-like [Poecilia formosa]
MKDHQSLMATLCENMLTVNMLLSVFFLPGVLPDACNFTAPALNITAPKEIEALSGSCLQIPCSFKTKKETFDKSATVVGVWMKHNLDFKHDPQSVIFNSSRTDNTDQLKIIGNLREKNCTTLFNDLNSTHADRYFFRVENGPFRATACSNPIKIKVKDSPWSPSINVPSDLKEHQSVTVTCSAFTPCPHSPPQLTWNLQQDSLRQTEDKYDITLPKYGMCFFFPPSGPIGSPAYWKGILVGIIVFICLIAVCAWYLKCKRPTPQKTQSQTSEDATVEKPANEKREEKLHYEEVNFLQRRLEASSMSAQDSRQQETVYSQLKVSVAPAEDLYAHV